jgi:hypothetical protein
MSIIDSHRFVLQSTANKKSANFWNILPILFKTQSCSEIHDLFATSLVIHHELNIANSFTAGEMLFLGKELGFLSFIFCPYTRMKAKSNC